MIKYIPYKRCILFIPLLKHTCYLLSERYEFNIKNKIPGNSIPHSYFATRNKVRKSTVPFVLLCSTCRHKGNQQKTGKYHIIMSNFISKLNNSFKRIISQ